MTPHVVKVGKMIISRYMPVWIVACAIIAYVFPEALHLLQPTTQFWLGLIFFFMGVTLSFPTLVGILRRPKHVVLGAFLKWTIMVGTTLLLANLFFSDNAEIAAGFILAGAVPSGTSANIYALTAGGEVALSITMATLDTFIAPFLTPSLVQIAVGKVVPIAFWPMFWSIIYTVLVPLGFGLFVQWRVKRVAKAIRPHAGVLSQLSLLFVVLSAMTGAAAPLKDHLSVLPVVFFAVILQIIIPMGLGYWCARWLKVGEANARSMLFHVGITNTALATTLAIEHISSLAAVPAVVAVVCNLTIGAIVANWWEAKN